MDRNDGLRGKGFLKICVEFARDKLNVAIVAFRIGARKVVFQTLGARDSLWFILEQICFVCCC